MVMEIEGKEIRFSHDLWVQHGGVKVAEKGQRIQIEAVDEDAYLKVLNHFGRVLKLFTFEGGQWVDADTGVAAKGVDESQAGRIPESARFVKPPKKPAAAKKTAAAKAKPKAAAKAKSTAKAKAESKAKPKPKSLAKPASKAGGAGAKAKAAVSAKGKKSSAKAAPKAVAGKKPGGKSKSR